MNKFQLPAWVFFFLAIIVSIFDQVFATKYGQIFGYLAMGYFAIYFCIIVRFVFKYPDSLSLRTFNNGMEIHRPLGRIVEYPGKIAHKIRLQFSPFIKPYEILLGEPPNQFQYYDVELKMKMGGSVQSFICGNLEKKTLPKKDPRNAKEVEQYTWTFKPTLLAKNYEEFLFAADKQILGRLNERMVKEQNRHLEILEQNANIFIEQENRIQQLEERLLKIARTSVVKVYSDVVQVLCKGFDLDAIEVNRDKINEIIKTAHPEEISLNIRDVIEGAMADLTPKIMERAGQRGNQPSNGQPHEGVKNGGK